MFGLPDASGTSSSFAYDGNGNATTYEGSTLGYDFDDNLNYVTFAGNGSGGSNGATLPALQMGYRSDGLRAWKDSDHGTRTYFIYDGDTLVAEMQGPSEAIATVVSGGDTGDTGGGEVTVDGARRGSGKRGQRGQRASAPGAGAGASGRGAGKSGRSGAGPLTLTPADDDPGVPIDVPIDDPGPIEQPISNSAGQITQLYIWGADGLISRVPVSNGVVQSGSAVSYLYDLQGSVVATLDSSGTLQTLNPTSYTAYGSWMGADNDAATGALATLPNDPVGFGGKFGYYTDRETGFLLCTRRYYDPGLQRWVNRDPIGYDGGTDLYAYCDNNPVMMVDPSGFDGEETNLFWRIFGPLGLKKPETDPDKALEKSLATGHNETYASYQSGVHAVSGAANRGLLEASRFNPICNLGTLVSGQNMAAQHASIGERGVAGISLIPGEVIAKAGASIVKAIKEVKASKTFIVYTIRAFDDAENVIYVGRASGVGTQNQVLTRRFANHTYANAGDRVVEDIQLSSEANKGAERVIFDKYKEEAAKKGTKLLNSNIPLNRNPKMAKYINAYLDEVKKR